VKGSRQLHSSTARQLDTARHEKGAPASPLCERHELSGARAAVLPRSTAHHLVLWRVVFACDRDKFNGRDHLRLTHAARNLSLQPSCTCCAKILASTRLGTFYGCSDSLWCLRLLVKAELTMRQNPIGWKSPFSLCEGYSLAAVAYASYVRLREIVCVWRGAQFIFYALRAGLHRAAQ
jgi:hypothetical protein